MPPITLDSVTTGKTHQPFRVLAYGPEKVGKSFLLAQAEGCVAIDVEGRLGHINVKKFPQIATWDEALEIIELLRTGKHDHKNVLIDSVSYLEKLLKVKIMADAGWTATDADEFQRWAKVGASSYWPNFFGALDALQRERGMGVLMTAHMSVKSTKKPDGEPYDKYRPALCGEIGPQLFLHYVHDVLFCTFEDLQRTIKKNGRERVATLTTGARIMYTTHNTSHDAGNSCGLPDPMPMDWALYVRKREEGLAGLDGLHEQIVALGKQVAEPEVRTAVATYAQANWNNLDECRRIRARLVEILEAQQRATETTSQSS